MSKITSREIDNSTFNAPRGFLISCYFYGATGPIEGNGFCASSSVVGGIGTLILQRVITQPLNTDYFGNGSRYLKIFAKYGI